MTGPGWRLIQADVIEGLRQLPAESVHCVVTSPPYWGLRDYGCEGQIGLEKTVEEWVAKMVAVFEEVRRVLREDGTVFLNLGDSYFGASGQREVPCGISDKPQADSTPHDCLCGSLCGVCREVVCYRAHTGLLPVSMLRASLRVPIRAHTGCGSDPHATSDYVGQEGRSASAMPDSGESAIRADVQLRASLVSRLGVSDPQLLGACLQRANRAECLLCGRSLKVDVPGFAHRAECSCGIVPHASGGSTQDKDASGLAYPYSTSAALKPKDLIGQPWRVAFALQAAGWYLRSDIIWSKPNPMPESVTDRPTKAHEYIFLLTKSERYFYDADAIREAHATPADQMGNKNGKRALRGQEAIRPRGNLEATDDAAARYFSAGGRNKRTVWEIATAPYPEAHFATFPPALVEPCIRAGTSEKGVCPTCGAPWERILEPEAKGRWDGDTGTNGPTKVAKQTAERKQATGGRRTMGWTPGCEHQTRNPSYLLAPATVLDPFAGTSTTGQVALENGRCYIGIELDPKSIALSERRLRATALQTMLI